MKRKTKNKKEDNPEFRKLKKELINTKKQLAQLEKMALASEITIGVIHEIKNLFTIIKGFAQVAKISNKKTDIDMLIKYVLESSERANNILADLIKFSKPKTEMLENKDIKNTIEEVLSIKEIGSKRYGIKIEKDYKKNLSINTDHNRLSQVILNIINNSFHAMPNGGTLKIKSYKKNNMCHIAIADTGVGIPPKNLSKIFKPFFTTKGKDAKNKMPGTGLGLSVCKRIIDDLSGKITVQSKKKKGSTFTIGVPIKSKKKP